MAQLTEKVFNEEMNEPAVHQAVRWYLASRRQGTHAAKTRTEVSGGGKKPWKQKGTGRARAGSTRSPLWRKGGVIFPPKPRDYAYSLPQKVRKLAARVVLSEMNREERIKVFEDFSLPQPRAKEGAKFLKENGVTGRVLIVLGKENPDFERGLRNIAGVVVVNSKDLSFFDMLKSDWIMLERAAIKQLEERLG
jgi:large subunit ribosomal protein L4